MLRGIYVELTANQINERKVMQNVNEHICLIMNRLTPSLVNSLKLKVHVKAGLMCFGTFVVQLLKNSLQ